MITETELVSAFMCIWEPACGEKAVLGPKREAKCEKIAERDGATNTTRAPHQPSRMEAAQHG